MILARKHSNNAHGPWVPWGIPRSAVDLRIPFAVVNPRPDTGRMGTKASDREIPRHKVIIWMMIE